MYRPYEGMMHYIRNMTVAMLLFAFPGAGYAVDPQREHELERRRIVRPPQPVVQQRPPGAPAHAKEREERQRRESTAPSQDPSGFRAPQTVSIDRLKLRSDTLVEYQFEQLQTLPMPTADQVPVEEAKQEEPPADETEQQEQPTEEIADTEPGPEETAEEDEAAQEQVVTAGGRSRFRIIEENDRIIVLQIDAAAVGNNEK